MPRVFALRVVLILAAILVVGCGSKNGTVPVAGTVTLDGQPLPNAALAFHSADGKGRAATARSGANGEFKISSYGDGDGIVPGEYKILVFGANPDNQASADKMNMDGKRRVASLKEGGVHANYTNIAKTPLKMNIQGKESITVALKKDGT
ncbi:MAG: carboxypeptidase regulatory-like domain-containing protein [Planctomycetes bacterium]|nr:carboxypeptidase regulatory-like domain-containing protein [Planctomycetota bacterium]